MIKQRGVPIRIYLIGIKWELINMNGTIRRVRVFINYKNFSLNISIFTMQHGFIINSRIEATVEVVPPQLRHREFLIWGIRILLDCLVGGQSKVVMVTIFVKYSSLSNKRAMILRCKDKSYWGNRPKRF